MKQPVLTVSYGKQLHKQNLLPDKVVTIGNGLDDVITYPDLKSRMEVTWQEDAQKWVVGNTALALNEHIQVDVAEHEKMTFYLCENTVSQAFDTTMKSAITFGNSRDNDVTLFGTTADFIFIRENKQDFFKVNVYAGKVYHNFTLLEDSAILAPGDQLYMDGITIRIGEEDLEMIAGEGRVDAKLPSLFSAGCAFSDEYPDYHRSPRIIYRAPEEKITIANPGAKPSKPTEGLMRIIIPPLMMIGITILIAFFQPRGIFILMTLTMTSVTVIISIAAYIKNWKKYKVDGKEREESYTAYLKQKTTELHEASEKQRHSLLYHYPNIEEIREMAKRVDSRIYEKTRFHHDFLTFRVGTGREQTSFSIDFREEEFTQKKDDLMEEAKKLKSQYTHVDHVPIATDLMHGPVGYIGPRRLVIEQLQLMVMQTALFHSYYDLQFITIFPEEEMEQWDWMRWLPHASVRDINVRGFVYHERSRDQVLNSLYQILKERKMAIEEQANKLEQLYFSPHYVVLITDEKLILDHTVMEFFNEDPSELGVSLVFVQDVMQSLPEHVKTVVDIRDSKNGNIILEQGELVNRAFVPDHIPSDFHKEDISRALAPLNHLQNLKNSIPESVTFLEMYNVQHVEELDIASRWAKNETYKTMAVPLGLRGKDDIVSLNLHEKAHGPHGLVAGTTGSGKSEIIQSYILSLAVNFHPHEVAFLLIDYKGGGMANLFKDLPHLLGSITNLDGAQSMRALASIKAELQKRQRVFGEHNVNHINQYQKLYKQGEVKQPMPHLFLISDEFAELKAEQPEFMKELVSTARIGRSLGIHLILATQKPSGVVDDQIWSNSKFKLALKVQNASDSNEILKTPDAAEITLPGRAYLQVGNNEIYELFQSAWSGADYVPDKEDEERMDNTIYAINDLGQYEILSEDLSGLDRKEDISKVPTELDAVIDHIHAFAESQGIEALPRPWLPPLPERIFAQDLHPVNVEEAWQEPKKALHATIGLLDQPELQAQNPLTLDLSRDGHVAAFSSPGYGKSTFLQTMVMDLARQHNPQQLHVYLLDFGTNGLLPLKELPHVADVLMVDEDVKIGKLLRRLQNELKDRKKKLSKYGVASMEMYEQASGEEVPHLLIVIDNVDSLADTNYRDDFEKVVAQVAREGASIGIHLVISAGRQNALKVPVLSNIKNQIALYMIDTHEPKTIVGRTDLVIEEIMGRGMVKVDAPTIFQTLLPVKGKDTLEIIEQIQHEAAQMGKTWQGARPEPIPMVPEILPNKDFMSWPAVQELVKDRQIPFAVDFEEVQPVVLDYVKDQRTLILADRDEFLERTFEVILNNALINEELDFALMDNQAATYLPYKKNVNLFANDSTSLESMIAQVQGLYEARQDAFKQLLAETNGQTLMQDFVHQLRPMLIFLPDISNVLSTMDSKVETSLANLIEQAPRIGIYFIVGGKPGNLNRAYDSVSTAIKKGTNGITLTRIADQGLLEVLSKPYKEPMLAPYEAYYIRQGQAEKIKIAAPVDLRKE